MTDERLEAPDPLEDGADEDAPTRGATIARFFVLPLLVVGTALVIFLVFNLMTFERRSPADELQEVRGGTANRRWQAAFELSRSIARIPPGPEREAFAAETRRVFDALSAKRPDDVKVRRYLVLVLGKLQDREARPQLLAAAKDPDPETRLYAIWALGMLQDPAALDAVLESSVSDDPGARKMAAYVLGKLGDRRAVPRLQVLLGDPAADVRWNAAIALASLGDASGLEVLRSMIDRASLSRQAAISGEQAELAMVSALQAFTLLRDAASLPAIERVAKEDPNLRVREAARKAAEATRAAAPAAPQENSAILESARALLVV
ncbi:MAG: HEAT repeat domain-containing protein [Acidobacteriota bacterium]